NNFAFQTWRTKRGREGVAWYFRRGAEPIDTNTKKIGKRNLFYGKPEETGIEDALQRRERFYAATVRKAIEAGALLDEDLETLFEFIGSLAIRTDHFREGMVETSERMMSGVENALTSPAAEEFYQKNVVENPSMLKRQMRAGLAR